MKINEEGLTGISSVRDLAEAVEAGELSPELAAAIEEKWQEARCILVNDQNGVYQIHPNAAPQSWREVLAVADSVERIEPLMGWGRWTAVYRVRLEREDKTYFVEEINGND